MEIQIERTYHIRLNQLEAAKTLVDPSEFQRELRTQIGNGHNVVVEGETVTRALPPRSEHVRKAMRKFKSKGRKVECGICKKEFIERGLNVHMSRAHGTTAEAVAEGTE